MHEFARSRDQSASAHRDVRSQTCERAGRDVQATIGLTTNNRIPSQICQHVRLDPSPCRRFDVADSLQSLASQSRLEFSPAGCIGSGALASRNA